MTQEINITIEALFISKQLRDTASILDKEVRALFDGREDFVVNSVETAMGNAIINLTTSVDASLSVEQIKRVTEQRVEFIFPFGVYAKTLNLKEEAEIYENE